MVITKENLAEHNITFADLASELGICEMSVRNKVSGKTAFTKLEKEKLEQMLNNKEATAVCTISRSSR